MSIGPVLIVLVVAAVVGVAAYCGSKRGAQQRAQQARQASPKQGYPARFLQRGQARAAGPTPEPAEQGRDHAAEFDSLKAKALA
jgi:hypothetical protein